MAVLNADQISIKKMVRELTEKIIEPKAAYYDHTEEFPWENIQQMAGMGLMGLPVAEEYDGAGLDTLSYVVAIEEIARGCAATAAIMAVHTSTCLLPLIQFGNEEQRKKFAPPLARGEKVGAFALTEPNAGSDASALATTAVEDEEHWILNGTKAFITNGEAAETYIVLATADKSLGIKGITAFIVEKGIGGFSIGKKEEKMGIRASSTTELVFENCRIPKENLLGKIGEGFKIAMLTLDGARIGIGAQALGIAQGALDHALAYSKKRIQFGKPISTQQAISFKLADMAMKIEAARHLVYHAAQLKDEGFSYGKESAMAKCFAADRAMEVTTEAVQILGGYGYSREYPVERMMRDAKITQIYEGTNEIQRIVIANHLIKN